MAALQEVSPLLDSGILRRPYIAGITTCSGFSSIHCLNRTGFIMARVGVRRTQQSHPYSKKYTIHCSKFLRENWVGPRGSARGGCYIRFQKAF